MSDFYTSVAVQGNYILVNGYLDGKRYKDKVRYRPSFFVQAKKSSSAYRTLEGLTVEKIKFDSIKEANDFYRQYANVDNFHLYGLEKWAYTYINEEFKGNIEYDPKLVVVHNLDIETDSISGDQIGKKPITLIGLGSGKAKIIFGYKEDYAPKSENVVYIKCKDEDDMLRNFINVWSDDDLRPDVVTGWNVEKFDIPFLVIRIIDRLGRKAAEKLSPWNTLREKEVEIWGERQKIFIPLGVSILDYFDLYKKFTYTQQESYTLDHIAFVEVGKRKLDYSEYGSLKELYNKNFEKFVDYNITDIERVYDIDEKNKFIELVYAIAYDAKVNYIDALGSVLIWDVIIHNYLMDKKIVIPREMRGEIQEVPGAFVKDPKPGMYDWVVSFDLQSLYPHLIMQYNISPETLVSYNEWGEEDIQKVIDGDFRVVRPSEGAFDAVDVIQAANGARFRKDKHGFLPELMKLQFKLRAEYKTKMLKLKKQDANHPDIQRYHNLQMAKKIQLNSAYGAIANEYCRYYDHRLAAAITLSGQLSVLWIEKKINTYLNKFFKTENTDYILAMDTDSCYITLKDYVERNPGLFTGNDEFKIEAVHRFCEQNIQKVIKKGFEELADIMNVYENAMFMKREAICDKGLWTAKKRYILRVWDNEGVRYKEPQIKYVGVEAVRSTVPQQCKDAIKDVVKVIFDGSQDDVFEFIDEFNDKFNELTFEDIAFPRGIKEVYKYYDPVTRWKKGAPIHQKAAIVYNEMIKEKNLGDKYPLIYRGDKIKFIYLKEPNPAHATVIAAPRVLPPELGLDDYIDRNLMFEKTFLSPIQLILDAVGYKYKQERKTLDALYVD